MNNRQLKQRNADKHNKALAESKELKEHPEEPNADKKKRLRKEAVRNANPLSAIDSRLGYT